MSIVTSVTCERFVLHRAVRALVASAAVVALSWVVAGGAAAQPAGPGPGNSPNAHACQEGGWQNLYTSTGERFSSQGECTSYAAQGGTLSSTPPDPHADARAACESVDGIFGVGGPDEVAALPWQVLWVCNHVPDENYADILDLASTCDAALGSMWGTDRPDGVIHVTCYLP